MWNALSWQLEQDVAMEGEVTLSGGGRFLGLWL